MINELFDLTGKTAIVTGASSGLGWRFSKVLAQAGANLSIVARRKEKLEQLREDIKNTVNSEKESLALQCDVQKEAEVKDVVEKTEQEFGKIDILINNAGISALAPVEDLEQEDWDKVMDTNLTGVFFFAKHAARKMKANKSGKIVNIASMFGKVGNTFFPATPYHASKGGVITLTQALAGELAQHGIQVNAIGPGFFESEMTQDAFGDESFHEYVRSRCPSQRPGREGELDGALIFLASESSSYVNGQTIFVDGGWTAV
ncbi:glucose 1-dehydrogenase [Natranaerobius thermophilus]|uniref:Short-chain dehydrogenase/reductase SDR n=1 Tax=Natranaerobius thermophilus (strain ATCC BAA-1301 / DSM 18059 / JW/NM-WN-LF) TaxID=457570 RepID=B2A7C1_NATTJ|nr:glucose 1-dehydrogenase [Natranaerobius thermophilus]ACB84315.1 short-chain dehydrogenase/reductase SDR [Natranaerobius thermophilus JW/NM-WN-LF]